MMRLTPGEIVYLTQQTLEDLKRYHPDYETLGHIWSGPLRVVSEATMNGYTFEYPPGSCGVKYFFFNRDKLTVTPWSLKCSLCDGIGRLFEVYVCKLCNGMKVVPVRECP